MSDNAKALDHERRLPRQPLVLVAPVIVGGIAGFLLVAWGVQETAIDKRFATLPEIHLWRLLIAAQFGYFAGLLPEVIRRVRSLLRPGWSRQELMHFGAAVVVILLLFLAPAFMAGVPDWGITVLDERLPWVPRFAGVVAAVVSFGLMLVYASYRHMLPDVEADIPHIREYFETRQHARWLLSNLGIMIALGTLTTGALRLALDAVRSSGFVTQPPPLSTGMVLAYGAFFTVLLAIIYTPIHIAEQAVGNEICEKTVAPRKVDGGVEGFLKQRKEVAGLLEVGTGFSDNLRASLSILSPMLAALFSILIEA